MPDEEKNYINIIENEYLGKAMKQIDLVFQKEVRRRH